MLSKNKIKQTNIGDMKVFEKSLRHTIGTYYVVHVNVNS